MTAPNFFIGMPFTSGELDRVLDANPPPRGFRLFPAPDRHFTVAFLGRCTPEEASAAWALVLALDLPSPWPIILGPVVPMGHPRRYSALSALVTEGNTSLEEWIASVRDPLLRAANRPLETRPVKAHLTLARPKRRAGRDERELGLEWASSLDLGAVAGVLDRIALYTWSPDRKERLFQVQTERALNSEST